MQITLADKAGFCSGVRRTLNLAYQGAEEYGKVYTLGPLIHNPQEVERLKNRGIIPVQKLDEAVNFPVLIRSHGAGPDVFKQAEEMGVHLIDATCPLVKKVQILAKELREAGHNLVILGEADHPEVIGILGWAEGKAFIIRDAAEAQQLPYLENLALVSQTTQTAENFQQVCDNLKIKTNQLTVHDTRCQATRDKQEEAVALGKNVDIILVIGGKNSANTKKLAEICGFSGVPTYHLETADDLDPSILKGKKKVGITAGASTPDWIIEEVIGKMSELEKQNIESGEEQVTQDLAGEEQGTSEAVAAVQEAQEGIAEEPEAAVEEETAQEEAVQEPENQQTSEEASEAAAAQEETEAAEDEAELETEKNEESQSFADAYNLDIKEVRRGARIKGTVVQVKSEELLVDIGGKSEGVLPASELSPEEAGEILEKFAVGDEIEVLVLKKENQEGYPVLSKKRIDQELAWDKLAKMKEDGELVTGKVTEVVKGGLLVDVGLRGFIPASLVALRYVEDLSTFIGQEMRLKILDCDRSMNKLVLSAKAVLKEEAQQKKAETLASIAEGQTKRGLVCRLTSFGAFVDVGGVDGLLHVSEMAWYRVNHPSDILKEGDEIDVYVLSVDPETEKISLGLKQLIPNPWSLAREKYPEGSTITAKVVRTAPFGAFLEVEPGVEGLVHISQLANHRVEKTEDVVTPGQVVDVKVLSVDPEAKRISLSIKGAATYQEEAPVEEAPVKEAPVAEESAAAEEISFEAAPIEAITPFGEAFAEALEEKKAEEAAAAEAAAAKEE